MELVSMILGFLGAMALISLVVALITIWVYVIVGVTYHICERIREYIERKFRRWY